MSDVGQPAFPVVPYFLALLSPGPNAATAPRYFDAHVGHIDAMAADHIVPLGGEFDNAIGGATAAYLLHTDSRAQAEAWAAKGPLVKHGAYLSRIERLACYNQSAPLSVHANHLAGKEVMYGRR